MLQNNKRNEHNQEEKALQGGPRWKEVNGVLHTQTLIFFDNQKSTLLLFLSIWVLSSRNPLFVLYQHLEQVYCFSLPTAGVGLGDVGKVGSASPALPVFRSSPGLKMKPGFEKKKKPNPKKTNPKVCACLAMILAFSWPISLCMCITYLWDRWVVSIVTYKNSRRQEEKNPAFTSRFMDKPEWKGLGQYRSFGCL